MKSAHERLLRLEALSERPKPAGTPAERAIVAAQVTRALSLSPPGTDRDRLLRELLQRVDAEAATHADLAALSGVDLGIVRIVSRLEASC